MSKEATATKKRVRKKYDLEERTAVFGKDVIATMKKLPITPITRPLITQVIKAAGSVGANYCEADDAESRKDFVHKLCIAKKEARECKHWLRMLKEAVPEKKEEFSTLRQEAGELNLIFNAIVNKVREG